MGSEAIVTMGPIDCARIGGAPLMSSTVAVRINDVPLSMTAAGRLEHYFKPAQSNLVITVDKETPQNL